MKTVIENAIQSALSSLEEEGKLPKDLKIPLQIERCREEKYGQFACNVALMLAKPAGKIPTFLAQEIIARLPPSPLIEKVQMAGPGFINFFVTASAIQSVIKTILKKKETFGQWDTYQGQRVHLEYVSANPTGPLHVGHGRSAAFGSCVATLLKAVGYEVHSEYYVNDAGRQMRILGLSTWLRYIELLDEQIVLPEKAYQGHYLIEIAQQLVARFNRQYLHSFNTLCQRYDFFKVNPSEEEEERALDEMIASLEGLIGTEGLQVFISAALETILADIKNDLEEFGVHFQTWLRESQLIEQNLITQGIELLKSRGYVFEKEGALWFRATDFGDVKDRVLLRANGQSTYFASDVAYHLYKYEQGYDRLINIFGADHHGYIQRIKAFLEGLGKDPSKLDIKLVQFAVLYRGNEKVPMSTRKGEFVTLRELRQEVGTDAARYFYIMRKPDQHLDFDLELAKSQSSDNPVYYIQYAYARIASVWKTLEKNKGLSWNKDNGLVNLSLLSKEIEKSLMNMLSQYPEVVLNAASKEEPHALAAFLRSTANLFHSYYNSTRFLIAEANVRDARLCLIAAVQQILKNGLSLLGLSAPESM